MNKNGNPILLRVKVALAHRIIAISGSTFDLLRTHGARTTKCRKIPLGIEVETIDTPLELNKHNYLLSVGNIVPLKRCQDAIQTLKHLEQEYPELCLLIAGATLNTEYYRELEKLVCSLNLEGRVVFLGPRNDILSLMRGADVLLHCAETEAFGWVILEAMSVGTPVIASAVEGPKEIILSGRTGMLVTPGNVDEYVEAVRNLTNNPSFRENITRNAYWCVKQNYQSKVMVERIAGVYRELFQEK